VNDASAPVRQPLTTERGDVGWPWQLAIASLMLAAGVYLWEESRLGVAMASDKLVWWPIINERTAWIPWIPISILIAWRWGWKILHWVRAAIYRRFAYPRLRKAAERAVAERGPVPELAVLAVTYKEAAYITRVVFRSVFEEVARVEGLERRPVVVAVTGSDEDDAGIRAALDEVSEQIPPERLPELVLLRGAEGKRRALASGLEWIRDWQRSPDGAFIMMDGDTHLEAGAISRALCFLRLDPPIAAVTTNEHVLVRGPAWFSEWLHLRHGLRDLYASSVALGRRLLCLTGRYSIFRGDVLDADFIEIVRNDHVENWLWGRYNLLSGDDKSTWYHLLTKSARMLYLPDVAVVTHEIVTGNAIVRAYHNLRRWGGNMVRNSERAILLGPSRVGPFAWWCIIDQRISMWTVLVGPLALAMMTLAGRWDLACVYLLWVMISRTVRVAPAWLHARRFAIIYAPLSAIFDWAAALVKIWIVYFPAKQFWFNRGMRQLDSTSANRGLRERQILAGGLLGSAVLVLVAFVAWLTSTVQVSRDFGLLRADLPHGLAGLAVLVGVITMVVGLAALIATRLQKGAHDV
jgi:mannuronan synthase